MRHTPGPWIVTERIAHEQFASPGIAEKRICISHTTETRDCFVALDLGPVNKLTPRGMWPNDEAMANAKLMAAALDLLAALEGCADALKESGKDFAQANRLAARPNLYELHEAVARAAIAKAKGQAACPTGWDKIEAD